MDQDADLIEAAGHCGKAMAAPLALDTAPHDDLPGWRRGEETLDSLAYIDGFTEQEKRAVELLIVEDVRLLSSFPFCFGVDMAAFEQ